MNFRHRLGAAAWAGLLGIAGMLQACGGGSDGTIPAPPPTALPATVAVTAAATAEPGADLRFASDLASPGTGLSFRWDFGDGQQATGATPNHSYAQPGDYAVALSVTNEAGASVQARWTVTVRRTAMLQGGVCSTGSSSGWCWQRPRPTGNALNDVQWLDGSRGWAVGQGGTILRTDDGGSTWQPQTSGVTTTLRKVQFFDRSNGWAIGDENTLLHTRDGGAHWQAQVSGDYSNYGTGSLQVLGADTALMLSPSGAVRITRDGGETWSPAADSVTAIASDGTLWRQSYNGLSRSTDGGASFTTVLTQTNTTTSFGQLHLGAGVVWLVATDYGVWQWPYYYPQTLWISTDAGATWQSRTSASTGGSTDASAVFADGSVWMQSSSSGNLLRSSDMGLTFTAVGPTSSNGTPHSIYNTTVLGPMAATVISGTTGQRYLTRDAGQTWQTVTMPNGLGGYSYLDIASLLADGSLWISTGGRYYRSADNGSTWRQVFGSEGTPNGGSTALSALWFHDAQQGVAVSAGGWAAETSTGGLTWTAKALTTYGQYVSSRGQMQFVSPTLGWMSLGSATLYRTTDGGKSWFAPLTTSISATVRSFHFVDANQGFVLLDDRRILRSVDAGGNWEALATLPMDAQSLRFFDAQTGVVVGSNGYIARTTDGGAHWTPRFSGTSMELRRVVATSAGVLWAVGANGVMLRSDDRGQTWTRQPALTTVTLTDLAFADANSGWAVGDNGVVLATRDGGASWQPQVTATSANLVAVFALDAYTAWIGTGDGGVLATGTGGR